MISRRNTYISRLIAAMLILIMAAAPLTALVARAEDPATSEDSFAFAGGTITDYVGADTDVVIPKTIGGETVIEIGDNAFQSRSISSLVIPETVTRIGDFAVSYVEGLNSVKFLGPAPEMGNAAFSDENGSVDGITFYCHIDYKDNYIEAIYNSVYENPHLETFGTPSGGGGTPPAPDPWADFDVTAVGTEGYSVAKYKGSGGDVVIPDKYQDKPVIAIGNNAFDPAGTGFSKITSVKMPDTVTKIGDWAFYNCIKMESINLSGRLDTVGEHAFQGCNSLTQITVPKGVSKIKDMAFAFCEKLQNIHVDSENENYRDIDGVLYSKDGKILINYPAGKPAEEYSIPEGTEIIYNDAFKLFYSNTTSRLKRVNFPESLKEIGDRAFMQTKLESIVIKPGIKMGEYVFDQCKNMKSVEIKEGVTKIEKGMLYALEGCETIKLPSTLKEIGYRAFDRLALEQIELPEGLETIGEEAFQSSKLTSLEIPASVNKIGPRAFYSSKELSAVSFDKNSNIKTIGEYAFNNCRKLETVNLPDSLIGLEDGAFSHCYALKGIKLPDNMVELDDVVFAGSALESMVLPSGIKSIGHSTFRNCIYLKSVKMPAELQSLGMSTFESCFELENAEFPETIGLDYLPEDTFFDCRAIERIYLPKSIKETRACAFSDCRKNPVVEYGNKKLKRSMFDCFPINLDSYSGYYEIIDSENMVVKITSEVPAEKEDNYDKLQTLKTSAGNGRAPAGRSSLCGCSGSAGSIFLPNCKPVFKYKPAASGEVVIPGNETQQEKPGTVNAEVQKQQSQTSTQTPASQYQNQTVRRTAAGNPAAGRTGAVSGAGSGTVSENTSIASNDYEEKSLTAAMEGSEKAEPDNKAIVPSEKQEIKTVNKSLLIAAAAIMAVIFAVVLSIVGKKNISRHQ